MSTESGAPVGAALRAPAHPGYFADPFVVALPDGGYAAFGTSPHADPEGGVFPVLLSDDLTIWRDAGYALERPSTELGDEYWAPEVCWRDGAWWMYYSVGHGIRGHHLRVARSTEVTGPFVDLGVNLTPVESFAIDPHPFQDADGHWYLYFARDVLDADRPGTHLAVGRLDHPLEVSEIRSVLAPTADWQIYERGREMYGQVYDWHTLEGPSVVLRRGAYWMTYSGGAWTGPGYHVSWATAPSPLGPWVAAPGGTRPLLRTGARLIGPGHNSLVVGPDAGDRIAFHAWDAERSAREMHIARIDFSLGEPVVALD